MKKSLFAAILGMLVFAGAALAVVKNSIAIQVNHNALVGESEAVVFTGHDNAPKSGKGTYLSAVLEPPISKGGSYCKANLSRTVKNHPKSKTLLYVKRQDPTHTGSFDLKLHLPAFMTTGVWRVCAWQYNNDGKSNFQDPASHAAARIRVTKS